MVNDRAEKPAPRRSEKEHRHGRDGEAAAKPGEHLSAVMASEQETRGSEGAGSEDRYGQRHERTSGIGETHDGQQSHGSAHSGEVKADFPPLRHDQAHDFATGGGQHEFAQEDERRHPGESYGAEQVTERPDHQGPPALAPAVDTPVGDAAQRTEHPHRQDGDDDAAEQDDPGKIEPDTARTEGERSGREQKNDQIDRQHQRMEKPGEGASEICHPKKFTIHDSQFKIKSRIRNSHDFRDKL